MASVLSESARKLSLALRPSDAWTADELRGYAASSIKQDEEFKETVGNITGLADRLAELIITPA